VLTRAAFRAALRRYAGADGEPWRADWIVYYFINDSTEVSFAIDVSACYDVKRRALDCHRSQFAPAAEDSVATRLTAPSFRQLIESRDAHLGALTGVRFAEGVVVREPLLRPHVLRSWEARPAAREERA